MFKKFSISLISLLLVVAVGCTPKKKEDGATEGDAAAGEPGSISSEAMNFSASGSDSGSIPGLSTVNFEYDSAALTGSAKSVLKDNAEWIKKNGKLTVQIEGHCDSRGSVEYNLALGENRAKAVKDYLSGLGVASNRLTIISYGKEKPLELGDSEEVNAKNRRANFVPLAN
jgi:peptidoglycan-associated lipoprotein